MKNQSEEMINTLEARMQDIITAIEQEQVGSQAHSQLITTLDDMTEIRNKYKAIELSDDTNKKRRFMEPIKGDTVVSGLISLAGIAMIMKYEQLDAITTKAFSIATRLVGR